MTQSQKRLQPLDFIIIYIGGAFLAGLLQGPLRAAFPFFSGSTAGQLLSGLWLQDGLMLALLILCLKSHGAHWRDIGAVRPQGRGAILGAVFGGFALYTLMMVLVQLLNAILPGGLAPQNVQSYMQPGDTLATMAFVVLTMGVFVPIVEEFIFRGYLYHSIAVQSSPRLAMLFTALIFGAAHLDWQRFLPLAIGGWLLNIIALRYRSTFASAISHGVWNTIMIILYYFAL